MNDIEKLQNMINESEDIVFFGGAGVSTESGIKDFRSKDGLYSLKSDESMEIMLSSKMFYNNTDKFFAFYKKYMNSIDAKPNVTHYYLKTLENSGKLKRIVTQNIDGLHSLADSKNVCELHGSIYKNQCIKCDKNYDAQYVFNSSGVPICECGGIIKPSVVLYGEMLPDEAFMNAINSIVNADMLIVAGTSLTVAPASNMVDLFNGKYLVIINRDETPYDSKANLVIHDELKNVFGNLK